MTRDDDKRENTIERSRRFDANAARDHSRQEPGFSNLDDLHEDGYEEPDRDTNFASGYRADSVEDEEEYDEPYHDESEPLADDDPDTRFDPDQELEEESDNWLDEEDDDLQDQRQNWPLGLILIGIVAVALLAAGGYGVLQQRAATQAELRELRATLAVASGAADGGASRGALETLQQSYDKLSAQAQALTLENRRLADTVAGLEAQLGAQQSVPGKAGSVASAGTAAPQGSAPTTAETPQATASQTAESRLSTPASQKTAPPPAAPAIAAAPTPAPVDAPTAATPQATSSPTGPWFVNFGTYASRNMADTWASRVRPMAGEVIVAANEKDGRTLYRVRVVGLTDRESAQQVARKLESDLRVPQLWVGRE